MAHAIASSALHQLAGFIATALCVLFFFVVSLSPAWVPVALTGLVTWEVAR